MSEAWIRSLAERYGLDVLKRVTTGTERSGFATFELTGPVDRVRAAWPAAEDQARSEGRGRDFATVRNSDADGLPYIELSSVWCEG